MNYTNVFFMIFAIAMIIGCSDSNQSGQANKRSDTNSNRFDPSEVNKNPTQLPPDSRPAPTLKSENLQILKDAVAPEVVQADQQLNKAVALKFVRYDVGLAVAFEDCRAIERAISTQYPLSTFMKKEKQGETGSIRLCPDLETIYDWELGELVGNSIQFMVLDQTVLNRFGRQGVKTLTVKYELTRTPAPVSVTNQYLIDANSTLIERTKSFEVNGKITATELSGLDETGNVLSRIEQYWTVTNNPYRLNYVVRFAAKDGSVNAILRNQNDGAGVSTQILNYTVPKDLEIDAVELSVLSRFTFYKLGDEVTDWPFSQYSLTLFTKAKESCGNGYIGFADDGSRIRIFGDTACSDKMDVRTSIE